MPTGTRECQDCGHVFPPPEPRIEATATTEAIMVLSARDAWQEVRDVDYRRHRKPGAPDSLRVDYLVGSKVVSEWVRRPVQGAPVAHPPLQRAADPVVGESVGITQLQMAQERDRLHRGVALEDRQQHRFPNRDERIGNGAPVLGLALRRQARIGVDPASGALAEPGAGGGAALAVTKTVLHVRSHIRCLQPGDAGAFLHPTGAERRADGR